MMKFKKFRAINCTVTKVNLKVNMSLEKKQLGMLGEIWPSLLEDHYCLIKKNTSFLFQTNKHHKNTLFHLKIVWIHWQ